MNKQQHDRLVELVMTVEVLVSEANKEKHIRLIENAEAWDAAVKLYERYHFLCRKFDICPDCLGMFQLGPSDEGPFAYCDCPKYSEWTGAPPYFNRMIEGRLKDKL